MATEAVLIGERTGRQGRPVRVHRLDNAYALLIEGELTSLHVK